MTTTTAQSPTLQVAAWRTWTTRILSGLLALAFGLAFQSLILLATLWTWTGEDAIHRVHGIGWGVAGGLVIAVGFASQAIAPRAFSGMQAALAGLVLAFVGTAIANPSALGQLAPVLVVGIVIAALHPRRGELGDLAPRSRVMLAMVVVAAIPLAIYAVGQFGDALAAAPTDPHVAEENHFESMGVMALALVATGYLAAGLRAGWRIPLYMAGIGAMLFGLASLMFTDAGSLGGVWGTVALLGGAAFIAVGEREGRRAA